MADHDHSEAATDDGVAAIARRLEAAGFALLSIHELAIDAQQAPGAEHYLTAIRELARSMFRGVDACIERLTGGPGMGNFTTEFEEP